MTKGEIIKNLRQSINMSQTEMAKRIGVSKQTLYKYENNIITNIPSDKIEAIAVLSGSTPAYIMGWNEKDSDAFDTGTILGKAAKDPDQIKLLGNYQSLNDDNRGKLLQFSEALTLLP